VATDLVLREMATCSCIQPGGCLECFAKNCGCVASCQAGGSFGLKVAAFGAFIGACVGLAFLYAEPDTDFQAFLVLWLAMKVLTWGSGLLVGAVFFVMGRSAEQPVWVEGKRSGSAPYGPALPSRAYLRASQGQWCTIPKGSFLASSRLAPLLGRLSKGGDNGRVSEAYAAGLDTAGGGSAPVLARLLSQGIIELPDEAEATAAWHRQQAEARALQRAKAEASQAWWDAYCPCCEVCCKPDDGTEFKRGTASGNRGSGGGRGSRGGGGGGARGKGPSAQRLAERLKLESKSRDEYRSDHYGAGQAMPTKKGGVAGLFG
jgi:hypothetical protein